MEEDRAVTASAQLPPWQLGLDGPARQIATVNASPLRVTAGPGTGKTFALIRRAARLLHEGADPSRMLVCTFTRTAAIDLKRELQRQQVAGATDVWAGTLHSFCFTLLNRAEVLTRTGRHARPLMDFEIRFLLEDLHDQAFGNLHERRKRLLAFNAAWARLQSDEPGWPADPLDRTFHAALLSWLRFHEAMLVGEIVPVALSYLRDNPASPHRRAFDEVLVDEYQDLNRAEQELLDTLTQQSRFAVVGDEDQSIYSFKHAHPEGISNFDATHAGTHDESLIDCRRCPTLIVEIANALIARNVNRQPRVLQPMPGNPVGEVHVVQWSDVRAEADGIAELIEMRMQATGIGPGQVLVLAPRRLLGYAVRDALNARAILAHSFFLEEALDGDPKVVNESDAQQAFTLLTLLVRPEDRVALRCWCGFGSPSLRAGAWSRLRAHCETQGISPSAALDQLAAGTLTLPNTNDLVARFRLLRERLGHYDGLTGQALVDDIFPEDAQWAQPFRAYAATIAGETFTAADLLEVLRAAITQPELPTDVDYVRVMSLHKSKGLTADLVVVVGCVEGLIPFVDRDRPHTEQARLHEEQRRLFYVAITRTRNILVLSSPARISLAWAHQMGLRIGRRDARFVHAVASTFLGELGPSRPPAVRGNELII